MEYEFHFHFKRRFSLLCADRFATAAVNVITTLIRVYILVGRRV